MGRHKKLLKVIVLGNSGVGKSCLINQYASKKFTNAHKQTIVTDFVTREVTVDGYASTLQLWDTAGLDKFRSLGVAFFRNSDMCVLVFDLGDGTSFEGIDKWKDEFINQAHPQEDQFPFVLIGNKADGNREVIRSRIDQWCKANNAAYFECSAKDGTDIDRAFQAIAERAMSTRTVQDQQPSLAKTILSVKRLEDPTTAEHESGGCC